MLRDATIQTTQHSLTSERVSKEVRYLSDTLEFSANAASLFLSPPVNKEFISWEDHYQFNSLESLLTVNRIQKRSAYSRKPTGVKQHTCHFESPPASQELALPPIASIRNASVKSPGIRKVKSRRSNFSVHSIPMDPSVDWANTISSAVDNFETVYLKSDSLTRLSPDLSLPGASPTERHTPDARVPEFLAEWETGQKPVFQPLSTLAEEEILLGNGLRFDKVLEPIIPARQCHFNVTTAKDGRAQGQRRWQDWPRPHKNVRSEGWLSVTETRELEEERREQERLLALSLASRKVDTYASGTAARKECEGSEFFLEEETGFIESRIVEEWLQKWSLPVQVPAVSNILQQLNSVNQLVRVQGAGLCALSCPPQEAGARLELLPQLEEQLQRLLSDESLKVRITAGTVLSLSHFEDRPALKKVLLEGAASANAQERWLSSQALACLLVPDPSVLGELSSRLVSDCPRERARALTLMGRLSPCSGTVHAIAADMITRVHWKQKIAGCSLVPLLSGGPKKDFQERLIRVMWRDWHSKVREAAARALGRAGKARLIHDEIRSKLTDSENEDLRLDALHKIRELKPPTRLLIPGLLACLDDNIISIRISCIKLVAELQIRDENILDALIELLKDDNWKVKLEAIKTLSQLSGSVSSPQLIASHLLWAGRYDRVAMVRTSALRTLSMLARGLSPANSDLRAEIVSALIDALSSDTEDSVRGEAERGLLDLGEEARQEDRLLEAIREEIKKLGQPADIAASILQSS